MKQPDDTSGLPDDLAKGVSRLALERLQDRVPCDDVIQVIADMLVACTPQGNPDWRARETGCKLWMSYVIGLPVMRQHIVQERINSAPSLESLLANPSTVETLRRVLAQAEAKLLPADSAQDNGAK